MTDMKRPSMTFVNDISFKHVRIFKVLPLLIENSIYFHVLFFMKAAPVLNNWNNKVLRHYNFTYLCLLASFLPSLSPSFLPSFFPPFISPFLLPAPSFSHPSFLSVLPIFFPPSFLPPFYPYYLCCKVYLW